MSKQKITMNELFSGIGAQKRGFDNSGVFDCEVLATCDLDKDAIVTYASNHCGLTKELIETYAEYPSREEMIKELSNKNIGYDFMKEKGYDWGKTGKKKTKELEKYWLAMHLSKNLGDITKINKLPQADLWFYSSPCQAFSISGKQEGSSWTCDECGYDYLPTDYSVEERYKCPKCGSEHIKSTTSGVLYEVERLLVEAKKYGELPKYLCLENVKNLVGKKFITNFEEWIKRLEALGYNTYWEVINAKDCGVPQNRERVFAFSIRKDVDNRTFTFPRPFDLGIRLKDVLEDKVEDKYYLSEDVQKRFHITDPTFEKNIVGSTAPCFRTIGQRDLVYKKDGVMGALVATDYKQPKQILDNEINMLGLLPIKGNEQVRRVYDSKGISPTLNTMQGGNRQPKVQESTYRIRKLTPTECFLLMGFTKEDVEKARALGMSDSSLYKQAGNSIVTNCITLLAQHLYKAQYDNNYICYDEVILSENF